MSDYLNGIVESTDILQSARTGTPYVQVLCRTSAGDSAEVRLWLTPKAKQHTADKLRLLGVTGRMVSTCAQGHPGHVSIKGTKVRLARRVRDDGKVEWGLVESKYKGDEQVPFDRLSDIDSMFIGGDEAQPFVASDTDVPF